jgi:hypothetical protein
MIEQIDVTRGEIVEHATIERVTGEKRDNPKSRYRSAVSRWRKRILTENGIWLQAVPRVGYKAVTASDQLRVPVQMMKRANRMVARGLLACEVIPDAQLDDADQARKGVILSRGIASLSASRDATAAIAARLLTAPDAAVKMTR